MERLPTHGFNYRLLVKAMGALPSCQCEWIGDELENLHLQKSKEKTPMHLKHIVRRCATLRDALSTARHANLFLPLSLTQPRARGHAHTHTHTHTHTHAAWKSFASRPALDSTRLPHAAAFTPLPTTPLLTPFSLPRTTPICTQDDLSPMEREALDETFAAIDLDGDGFISVDELKAYCTQYERVNVDKVADDIMRRLDKDSDGRMDVAELLAANLGGMLENARASSGMYNKVETMH